jgi:Sap, sulfolipid-1-addressing protein
MLGEAIGDLLPAAVGVALSPVPIVAVILMLGTPRARTNGPAFAAGWVAGLVTVGVTGLSAGGDAVGLAVFVVIGSVTVVGPVLAYLFMGQRAERALGEVKQFMADHNAVIMAVVCLVLAAKLIGNGIGGLAD